MSGQVANITGEGARRRRLGGMVWLGVAIVASAALVLGHAPQAWRVWLIVPFGLAASGFLQAREKT